MAIVERFIAGVQVWDSATLLGSFSQRVGAADARLYLAAANQAARDATDVGLLLITALDMTATHGANHYKKWFLNADFINDAATPEPKDDQWYRSNSVKVTYVTTQGGIPVQESTHIPMRRDDFTLFGSNPVQIDFTSAGFAKDFADDLIATGLSSYGTAITSVVEMTLNDE